MQIEDDLKVLRELSDKIQEVIREFKPDSPATDDPDPASFRDVTPDRFARLEKELVRGKAEIVRLSFVVCHLS